MLGKKAKDVLPLMVDPVKYPALYNLKQQVQKIEGEFDELDAKLEEDPGNEGLKKKKDAKELEHKVLSAKLSWEAAKVDEPNNKERQKQLEKEYQDVKQEWDKANPTRDRR